MGQGELVEEDKNPLIRYHTDHYKYLCLNQIKLDQETSLCKIQIEDKGQNKIYVTKNNLTDVQSYK